MTKQAKVFIFIFIIAIALISFLVLSSKIIIIKENDDNKIERKTRETIDKINKIDPAALKNEYEKKIKPVFREFEKILMQTGIELKNKDSIIASSSLASTTSVSTSNVVDQISRLKIEIMELTVPEEYKEFHFNLIMLFNKFKDFIISKKESDRSALTAMLEEAKDKNKWLSAIK